MSTSWPRAASALRTLIRAERQLFQNDPQRSEKMLACRELNRQLINLKPRARRSSRQQSAAAGDGAAQAADPLENGIQAVLQTATVFRQNIVQGLENERGNFVLNIHSETELGDNESIMQQKTMAAGQGCCSAPSPSAS